MKRLILFIVIASFFPGCAHVVSKDLREQADKSVPVSELFRDPEAYKGKVFVLGGVIVDSANAPEGTYIEVLERPLDYRGRPLDTDISRGRFIILQEGYVDTEIFSRGREVTVAGEVIGTKVKPLGEIDYTYPLIKSMSLNLLRPGYDIPVHFGIGVFHSF